MTDRGWEIVRDFYLQAFNIPPELVELMSSNDIMLMAVSGASNKSISESLQVREEDVREILSAILNFRGWEKDLDINPYFIFTNMRISREFTFEEFRHEVLISSNKHSDRDINIMFAACKLYYDIDKKLEELWI